MHAPQYNYIMKKIVFFISGSGSNLGAVIDAIKNEQIRNAEIVQVISSNSDAFGLERAKAEKIATSVIHEQDAILPALQQIEREQGIDLIVLAGYMKIIPKEVAGVYSGKIINIHPSLIPKHAGKGYYGLNVHKSVIDSGDKTTGVTVHYVDEGVDTGKIIKQEVVEVLSNDDPHTLQKRVLEVEHKILPQTIKELLE